MNTFCRHMHLHAPLCITQNQIPTVLMIPLLSSRARWCRNLDVFHSGKYAQASRLWSTPKSGNCDPTRSNLATGYRFNRGWQISACFSRLLAQPNMAGLQLRLTCERRAPVYKPCLFKTLRGRRLGTKTARAIYALNSCKASPRRNLRSHPAPDQPCPYVPPSLRKG